MKIMFVGVFNKISTNISQIEAFENLGHEIIPYDYRVRQKVIGTRDRDAQIINISKKLNVDFIIFSKCNEISINCILKCNDHTKTILWYMDCMNNFNTSLISKVKHCNCSFFAHPKPFEEALRYSKKVYFLEEGYDENIDKPINTPFIHDVSFIGNLDSNRKEYIKVLNKNDINVFNYSKAYAEKHSKAVCESKINLNFIRDNSGPSDRIYKVMAAGGFLLSQPWKDCEKDFEVGIDFGVFITTKSLVEQCHYYLMNENIRKIIASYGHEKNKKFTRTKWAKFILERINYV